MFHVTSQAVYDNQSRKFSLPPTGVEQEITYRHPQEAYNSPLARKILGFPWAQEVRLGSDYLVVFKQNWIDWSYLEEPLKALIDEHLELGQPVYVSDQTLVQSETLSRFHNWKEQYPELSPALEVLEKRVLPILAADGGWIEIQGWLDGCLFLSLEGACGQCPSSQTTWHNLIRQQILDHAGSIVKDVVLVPSQALEGE